jgi:hypothetical protein
MNRFIPHICCVLCLLLGLSVGWYIGYVRPVAKNQRKLLREYQTVRDGVQLTDEEMSEAGQHVKEWHEGIEQENELAAAMGLAALIRLEQGDMPRAKKVLLNAVSVYYMCHSRDGDTNVLRHIEIFAATNTPLSNAIYGKLK